MTLMQLLRILCAHRWAELATLGATLVTALILSFVLPKQYTATATMIVDLRSTDPIAGTVLPASSGYIATQVNIVRSDRVTQAVTNNLDLLERPFIRSEWLKATDARIPLNAWIPEFLQKRLGVVPAHESNVINISFTADTPEFAAEGANAFAQAYRAVNLELRVEPARVYALWFAEQTKFVRERLETAQKALSDFQQRAGILPSDNQADFESAKLNEMATQLNDLQAEITANQNKLGAQKPASVSDVMRSNVVTALKIDIARLTAQINQASGTLLPNHPYLIRTKEELSALKVQLADETRQINASIGTSYEVDRQREHDLQQAIAEQKARVLALNKQRDELNVYKRDVESAQRAFEAVSQRAAQTRLESLSKQADMVSLSAARQPIRPSRPRLLFNLLVATCIGSMLAAGLGLLLELRNRRVRAQEDLDVLGLPVLATLRPYPVTVQKSRLRQRVPRLAGMFGIEALHD
jgi:succinoglycan biosynthesis transport protein ExoP